MRHIISSHGPVSRLNISLDLFLTSASASQISFKSPADLTIHSRRINDQDLHSALVNARDKVVPKETVAYVCGPPVMTDELVEKLQKALEEDGTQRVFFEKWW